MLCHQCGSPVEAAAAACPNCGAELKTTKRLQLAGSKGLRISQQLKAIKLEAQLFPPGEVVAERFVLGEMIGKGPFGEVYRATDREIDAEVAVKIFDKEVLRNPPDHERFLNITRAARSMTQANVVRIHDSGVHRDHPWVSMQYLEGLSLRKVLDLRKSKGETFELDELEPIVSQITLALQHVSRDFPHGDLKPENIIFLPDLLKITDSYILAALPAETIIPRLEDSTYLAPELHAAKTEPDARADVYSVGMILGEMMFGPDYTAGSQSSGPHAAIDALVKRATAFDPKERYPSVEALSEDLTAVIDTGAPMQPAVEKGPPPPPPNAPPPTGVLPPAVTGAGGAALDPEEQKPTIEYDRDIDIQDAVLTREVGRRPPPKRLEETAAVKRPGRASATATMHTRAGATSAPPYGIIAAIVAGLVLLGVTVWFVTRPDDDVEHIGQQPETVVSRAQAAEPPKVEEPAQVADKPADPEIALASAATEAQKTLRTAGDKAAVAVTADAQTPPVADPPTNASTSNGAKRPDTPPQKTGAKKPDESAKAPAKSTGTDCPSGMRLIKSSKLGNYCIDAYEYPGAGSVPKTRVSWFQAKKVCESSGKRLCKLGEWRSACGSKYPYGKTFDANKCNTVDEDGFERSLAKAGSFKGCRSRSGAHDMVGNAHEWVEEQRIAGGGFESDEEVGSCRYSSPKSPASSAAYIGFRCCATP